MEIQKTEFKSINEITKFLNMNKTDTANYYTKLMENDIKIIGNEQDVYFYDKSKKLWQCNTKEVYNCFLADYLNSVGKSIMNSYKKLVKEIDDEDDESIKKIKSIIQSRQKEFDSDSYITAIIKRSTGKLQDNRFVTKLNSNVDYLPITNGKKVNLKTGEVSDRDKNDYFSFECSVEVTKTTEQADKFFKQVMPNKENREYLRKVLGYILTGNMDARVFFIWYGDGSNGKSVIMRLLKCILCQLYHQCSKGIFMKGSQEKVDGPSPDKVALIGIRCATYSEGETADDIDINESFLKMVSGKDEINARALFRAPLTFFPVCKMNLLTNYKPDLNGDKSMKERVRYLFFDSSFVDNPSKKNEFKKDEDFIESLCDKYLSQVFTWILKGSIEYYKTKAIVPTEEFQERTDKFFNLQDSLTSFIANKIKITNDLKDYKRRGDLFELYREYCNDNSQRCQKRSTLWKRLDDLKIMTYTLDGYDVYRGIKIIDNDEQNNDESLFYSNNEYDTLSKLYDKRDKQCDEMKKRIEELENKVKVLNDQNKIKIIMNNVNNLVDQVKKINELVKIVPKLEKKCESIKENVNEIDMRVAYLENEQMYSEEEDEEEDDDEYSKVEAEDTECLFEPKKKVTYTQTESNIFVNDDTGEVYVRCDNDDDLE